MSSNLSKGSLYIVSTPIGNIKDITLRALEILNQVDIILAEDTRSIQYLLSYYQIQSKSILSYHSYNEQERTKYIMQKIASCSVALVSEAGTPLICDPGILLLREAIQNQINIVPIPGVSAFTTLLPITGFSLSDFYFKGFLSSKKSKKLTQIKELVQFKTIIIIYEVPHRIEETINQMNGHFHTDTQIVIGRELTKKFQTIYRFSLQQAVKELKDKNFVLKGEFCIIIDNRYNVK